MRATQLKSTCDTALAVQTRLDCAHQQDGAHLADCHLGGRDGHDAVVVSRERCIRIVAKAGHHIHADVTAQLHGVGLDCVLWVVCACSSRPASTVKTMCCTAAPVGSPAQFPGKGATAGWLAGWLTMLLTHSFERSLIHANETDRALHRPGMLKKLNSKNAGATCSP